MTAATVALLAFGLLLFFAWVAAMAVENRQARWERDEERKSAARYWHAIGADEQLDVRAARRRDAACAPPPDYDEGDTP